MIDRYAIFEKGTRLKQQYGLVETPELTHYNAAPTQKLPIISRSGQPLQSAIWGTTRELAKGRPVAQRLINHRADVVKSKPVFRKLLQTNRVIVPMSGFYIWKQMNKRQKIPYYFYLTDQTSFGVAAICETYEDMDDKSYTTFSIITLPSPVEFQSYQDYLPAVLSPDKLDDWLEPNAPLNSILTILDEPLDQNFSMHSVSPGIANEQNNSPKLIDPIAPADQHGNYTLFG